MKHFSMRRIWISVLVVASCFVFSQRSVSQSEQKRSVARVWQGKVSPARADEYARYLIDAGMPLLKGTPGNLGVQVLRKDNPDSVEFTVISYWASREVIKKFAGEDIELAHALPRDPEFLLEPVKTVRHYDVIYAEMNKLGNM